MDEISVSDVDEIMIMAEDRKIACSIVPMYGDYIGTMRKAWLN